jgi:hypothetical protein
MRHKLIVVTCVILALFFRIYLWIRYDYPAQSDVPQLVKDGGIQSGIEMDSIV